MITVCFFFTARPYTEETYPLTEAGCLQAELDMNLHLTNDVNNSCLATVGNKSALITSPSQLLINQPAE